MTIRSVVAFVVLLCTSISAQLSADEIASVKKSMPPFKIETKADDDGQLQWQKFQQNCAGCSAKKVEKCTHCDHMEKPEFCVECKTTRKAPCHYCGGAGELPDPLTLAPCPGCNGHGVLVCQFCGNKGKIFLNTGGKSGQKCDVCKGNGGVACTVCDGKRFVDSPYKGKIGTQKLKKLLSTKKNLDLLIRKVESFRPEGKARLDRKKFKPMFDKIKRDMPVLKDLHSFVDDMIKRLEHNNIKDNDKAQVRAWRRSQQYLLYYLLHQAEVFDQCIARAEANAKAEKKK